MVHHLKVEVGALNVRIHPHSQDRYRELFRAAFRLKEIVNLRGDRSGMITSLKRIGQQDRFVNGVLSTFLDIDLEGEWLNTDTLKPASHNEVEEVSIPDNLRPNMMSFYFRFDVEHHELVFEHYGGGKRLTHNTALSFFRRLFSSDEIEAEFGDVKISIVQSEGSIDKLFSIPRITSLEVYIERPNSDLWGGEFEEIAEEHLEDKNARSMTVSYKAEAGQGIERDDDLDALVRTGLRNGRAVAKGYGPQGHETVTTDRYPKVVQDKFDPEDMNPSQMFESLADRFRRR